MTDDYYLCPLCDRQLKSMPAEMREGDVAKYVCDTCGTYKLMGLLASTLKTDPKWKMQRYLLSAYVKSKREYLIDNDLLKRLGTAELRDRTAMEKLELLVKWFAASTEEFGQKVKSVFEHNYPIAWCKSPEEWKNLLFAACDLQLRYLNFDQNQPDGKQEAATFSVDMEGWKWLNSRPEAPNPYAFVAMNFSENYQDLRGAISKAITEAGYLVEIVNESVFIGGIMDKVLALIRQSKFVVADYTENRGGVYYEAGFALGLGKTVISTCSQKQLDSTEKNFRLHFDVSHLKMIPWDEVTLDKFSERLSDTILALFGDGGMRTDKK